MAATSRRTFYRYFDGKKDLEDCVLEHQKNKLFYAMRKSVLPLSQDISALFDESVVFASTYKPLQDGNPTESCRFSNDYINLYATCMPDKWMKEWKYFYESAQHIAKGSGKEGSQMREQLACMASRLVLIYRQSNDDSDFIKQTLHSLKNR